MSTLKSALEAAATQGLAQKRLGDFIALMEPTYERARHTVTLCEHLEAVESGKILSGHFKTARLWAVQNRTPQAK
jgi:hypothetical protein